jgi:hypothetical protein
MAAERNSLGAAAPVAVLNALAVARQHLGSLFSTRLRRRKPSPRRPVELEVILEVF